MTALTELKNAYVTDVPTDGGAYDGCSIVPLPHDFALIIAQYAPGTNALGITGGPFYDGAWIDASYVVPQPSDTGMATTASDTITIGAHKSSDASLQQLEMTLGRPVMTDTTGMNWTVPYSIDYIPGTSGRPALTESSVTVYPSWYSHTIVPGVFTPNSMDNGGGGGVWTIDVTGLTSDVVTGAFTVTTDTNDTFGFDINAAPDFTGGTNSGAIIWLDLGDVADWQTVLQLAKLDDDGWTLSLNPTYTDFLGHEVARAAAVTSTGNVLVMDARGVRGYALLEVNYTLQTVTRHTSVPVATGPYDGAAGWNNTTYAGQPTSRLPGTNDFIFLRKTDVYQYAEAVRVSGTTVTVLDAIVLSTPSNLGDGWGTVVTKNATTAFAALAFPATGGCAGPGTPKLRTYEIVLASDALSATYIDYTRTYRDNTELFAYPTSLTGDTGLEAAAGVITVDPFTGNELFDLFLLSPGVGDTALGTTPLPDLPADARPEGVSADDTTVTVLDGPRGYVVAEDALLIVRSVYIDPTDASAGGRVMLTQYDASSLAILDTLWDRAPNADSGTPIGDLSAMFNTDRRQALFVGTDVRGTSDELRRRVTTTGAIVYPHITRSTGDLRLLDYVYGHLIYDLSDGGHQQRTRFT